VTDPILVHVITKLELGGAQLATLHEVAHSRIAPAPRYLVFGSGGLLDAEARALPGVQCREAPSLGRAIDPVSDLRAVWELQRILRDLRTAHPGRPLLVHTHSSKAGIVGRWAARWAGAACIVHTIHGFGHQPGMRRPTFAALWLAERATARITDGFTADSEANLVRGRRERLLGDVPQAVVRCGIDLDAFAPRPPPAGLRERLGLTPGQPVVLNVSCLKPQKDPRLFVQVAAEALGRHPDAVFLHAGDGELREQVEADIAARRLQGRVRLLGWRRDVPDLLHLADVLLLTSRWEGLPQVFPQAMAAAKPIVATAVDGAPEAIAHGETGFLAPHGDAAGLAAALCRLIADPDLRRRMGEAGRRRAAAFSQAEMVRDLDAFYERLLRKDPSGSSAAQAFTQKSA
jgi:glycosyltransferase involved in cell wall biosynthesis